MQAFLASLACDGASKVRSALARTLLIGVLVSFDGEDQCSLVQCAWATIASVAVSGTSTQEAGRLAAVTQCVRAILLAVEDATSVWLIHQILSGCNNGEEVGNCGTALPSVAEALVVAIPVTHFLCREACAARQMVERLIAQSVRTIEQFGGEVSGGEGVGGGISVGCAVAVLRTLAGREDGSLLSACAAQSAAHAGVMSKVISNAGLGTTLLRWVSSLSEHVRTLLCSGTQGSGACQVNLHRVSRAQALVATLMSLLGCFWSHKLPRAVQQIVGKSVVCCLAAASTLVEQSAALSYPAVESVSAVVLSLMQYASLGLKVISSGNIVDKSIEVIRFHAI
jgi:hypothetical protein